jgi:hypothetical protein
MALSLNCETGFSPSLDVAEFVHEHSDTVNPSSQLQLLHFHQNVKLDNLQAWTWQSFSTNILTLGILQATDIYRIFIKM